MAIELSFPSPHPGHEPRTRQCLVYFITGNPGLIDYYGPFLSHLRALLDAVEVRRQHAVAFHIYGRNLDGFDDADHPAPFDNGAHPAHDVEYQIRSCLGHLAAANSIPTPGPRRGQPFDEVVLVGHSLGTYIALEIFHRHLHDPAGTAPGLNLNLRAGVLLFATVAQLARSPKGVWLDAARRSPLLRRYVPALARALLSLLPTPLIRLAVRHLVGHHPPHAAETTTRFLASRDGAFQALHLGLDEIAVIGDEAWAEELWEVAEDAAAARHEVPKFFVFFGRDDHWVAEETRNEFIGRREEHAAREGVPGHKRARTRIEVDEGDLPHDFCIHHSETVAEKVSTWIDEIAEHP